MRGPFLPIYGSGAIMMLVVSMPFQDNVVLTYLAGCVGATILEYITGVTMEALFKVRYWDYTKKRFNFQGHICLGSTVAWGFLTILMTEIVHIPVEKLMLSIPEQILTAVTLILTAVILVDFALSFKAAIDLRNVLMKMEQAKEEMVRIQKRLDVIIALANEEKEKRKEERNGEWAVRKDAFAESMTVRMEDLKAGIESKLDSLKAAAQIKPSEYLESVKEELLELKAKYAANAEDRKRMSRLRDFFQRDMVRSNPDMTSVKFREALEEVKNNLLGK